MVNVSKKMEKVNEYSHFGCKSGFPQYGCDKILKGELKVDSSVKVEVAQVSKMGI
ncbi:MAG: hypothetical protein ACFFDI_23820 [Promethearchaeota archaeon]